MKKTLGIAVIGMMCAQIWAADIEYQYVGGSQFGYTNVLQNSLSLLPAGDIVRVGNFGNSGIDLASLGTGGLTPAELSQINAAFEQFLTFDIGDDSLGASPGAGEFAVGTASVGGTGTAVPQATAANFTDETAFILIYNVNNIANVDSATEFGLIQLNLAFPDPGDLTPIVHNTGIGADLGTTIGGLGSFASGGFQLASVAIPEPGTWAAMVAAVLGLAVWRARRKR